MLGCVIGGVGMAGMPYPPNLCASVSICGRLSLPECSVCSAYSVGHSLCLLCWCCRGSCTSVVVFSPRNSQNSRNSRNVRLRYWRRGYGRMPYPPNLCASVSICGRHFSARMFCVFRVFCGNTLSPSAWLVQLGWCSFVGAARLVHLRQVHPLRVPLKVLPLPSDCVRRPIRFRSPSDQIPFAARCHK